MSIIQQRDKSSFTNAFDFLRIMAASAVLYSHAYAIYGLPEPSVFAGQKLGTTAVAIFFAISGYLVAQSWVQDPCLWRFFIRRILRIVPGLVVAVLVSTFIVGMMVTNLSITQYLTSRQTWTYIFSNIALTGAVDDLPGVFENNPYPRAINGSLWTLRYEVMMYIIIGLLGWLCSLLRQSDTIKSGCLILGLIFFSSSLGLIFMGIDILNVALPIVWRFGYKFDLVRIVNLGSYFFFGCCLFLYRTKVTLTYFYMIPALISALLLPKGILQQLIIFWLLPYMSILLAWNIPKIFKRFRGFDYSYGVYIYAFPLSQMVVMKSRNYSLSFNYILTSIAALTFIISAISWTYVEKPALLIKNKLRS